MLGVQRELAWGFATDVAYVGNAARNQFMQVAHQRPALRLRLPAVEPGPDQLVNGQAQPLPDDLLRPYQGWGRIRQREFSGYSDYHSIQMSANRRSRQGRAVLRRRLHLPDREQHAGRRRSLPVVIAGGLPVTNDNRESNYNASGRRPHTLTFNYAYDVPGMNDGN